MKEPKENIKEEEQDRSDRHDSEYIVHDDEMRSLDDYPMED